MATAEVRINDHTGAINPDIYGHFIEHLGRCIYDGIWVGEKSAIPNTRGIRNDMVGAVRRMGAAVIRWPGGCFADDYHWEDGIGPRERRPRRLNLHWGGVESNEFGTHEFVDFCRQAGAAPYICLNVGSGTAYEARRWIEYCNCGLDTTLAGQRAANGHPEPFGVVYWGIGNENWGCGGSMTPEDYANEVCRFTTFVPRMGVPVQNIACGPSGNDADWSHRFFSALKQRNMADHVQGYAAHLYYHGSADVAFTDSEYDRLLVSYLDMERLVKQQRAIMDGYDPDRRIGLIVDEWGAWHPQAKLENGLEQHSTLSDALVAAAILDVFNRHADKIVMSNTAQMVNVLQCVACTQGEQMFLTPTYHVYEMYKPHQGGESLGVGFDGGSIEVPGPGGKRTVPTLTGSASLKANALTVSLVTLHRSRGESVRVRIAGGGKLRDAKARILTAEPREHNTFDHPRKVRPKKWDVKATSSSLNLDLPAHSLAVVNASMD